MKNIFLTLLFLSNFVTHILSQGLAKLSLLEAYELLEKNYPLLQNEVLLEETYQLDLKNLEIATKPILQLMGEGRIQSETPGLEAEGLPINIDLPFYNLKTYAAANYSIYDGGLNEAQKAQKAALLNLNKQHFKIEKHQLKERINTLFIAILLNRAQSKLLDITKDDLLERRKILAAGVEYGTVLESEVSKIQVRTLEIDAQKSDLKLAQKGYIATLTYWTGIEIAEDVTLVLPALPNYETIPPIARPELALFQAQKQSILSQEALIAAQRKPKVAAFAQAGIGYPNQLNFFDKSIAPYGIIGINFQWQITDWKKEENDRALLALETQKIDRQKATFEFNIQSKEQQYLADIERLNTQIEIDQQIAQLQAEILKQLSAQLEHGVITATEYLIQVNAELTARQKLNIHQTQLLQAQLTFLNERAALK